MIADMWEARDPNFEAKIRASFEKQLIMRHLGARLVSVEPGEVRIELPFRKELTQQHGFLHAGATTTIADSAGGYASYSLMPSGSSILTVEFKVNLMAPAKGDRFLAIGRVKKPGRNLFFAEFEVLAIDGENERVCLTGSQTNMRLEASDKLPEG